MPSSDQPLDSYSSYLETLSHNISQTAQTVPEAPMIIRQCVSGSYHCNGYSSCSNDSDEEGCSVHVSICTCTN